MEDLTYSQINYYIDFFPPNSGSNLILYKIFTPYFVMTYRIVSYIINFLPSCKTFYHMFLEVLQHTNMDYFPNLAQTDNSLNII